METIKPGFKILGGDGKGMLNIQQTCFCGNQKTSKTPENAEIWILSFATPSM